MATDKKVVDKKIVEVTSKPKAIKKDSVSLSVPVFSLIGKDSGTTLALPKEIFGEKVNVPLLAQALRIYNNNLKGHFGNTKTRGEVAGSTRKIYRQKGTGGARHGARYAPIFVGGGIAFGPKERQVRLDLPKKMKDKALISSLSQKAQEQQVVGLTGLEKATGKTKEMAKLVKGFNSKSTLVVIGQKNDLAVRAIKNLEGVAISSAQLLNAFEVIKYHNLVLTKEALESLQKRLLGGSKDA